MGFRDNWVMNYFGYPVINTFRSMVPVGFYHPVKGHTGIDIATPMDSPLSLDFPTTVASIKTQAQMGLTLYLDDGFGNILVFSHLNSVLVGAGGSVSGGQIFARTGNSGSATTGPHLHFEIIAPAPQPGFEIMTRTLGEFSGYNIDPIAYLDGSAPHWSSDALSWMLTHEIITESKDPNGLVTWGELSVVSKRLAERVLEWI